MAPKPHQVVLGLLIVKLENHVFRKEKKKMKKINHVLSQGQWNVQDFGGKLSLKSFGLDVHSS
jgi:hypothetical protein